MANGYVQAQFESIPGNEVNTPTLSTKTIYFPLITAKPDLNPDGMDRDDELRNVDEPLAVLPEAYDPAFSYESRAYPDLLGFFLKNCLGAPTTTAGNGVITDPDGVAIPTGASKHVWTAPFYPASSSAPQTAQYIYAYKDQSVFYKVKGQSVDTINLSNPAKGGTHVQASGNALYMARVADPALSPTYESLSLAPFKRANLTLPTWLASTGETEDISLAIAAPTEPVRSLGIASKFPDTMDRGEGLITVTGSIPKRILTAADWDAMLNLTGFAATIRYVHETVIAGSYPHKFFVSMSNCQYLNGEVDALDNKRRHGGTFSFKATNAGSASVTITLVNATASYA